MENAHWKTTAVCSCVRTNFHNLSEASFKICVAFFILYPCHSHIWLISPWMIGASGTPMIRKQRKTDNHSELLPLNWAVLPWSMDFCCHTLGCALPEKGSSVPINSTMHLLALALDSRTFGHYSVCSFLEECLFLLPKECFDIIQERQSRNLHSGFSANHNVISPGPPGSYS